MATTNSSDTTATPPLLTLLPVLLTHILLYLEPHEIICAQTLTTRHPAFACLEEEGAVDGGLWKQVFELGLRRVQRVEEYFALVRQDKAWPEARISRMFDLREFYSSYKWDGMKHDGQVTVLEGEPRLGKDQFRQWAEAFRCAGGCGFPGAGMIQCHHCGDFVCGKRTCTRSCAGGVTADDTCLFKICRRCFDHQQVLDDAHHNCLLLCCPQCPMGGRRCPYHWLAGMRACKICSQGRCGQHRRDFVTCNGEWCPVSLCSRAQCIDKCPEFTQYRCDHHGDRATLCWWCVDGGRVPTCSYCASPMIEE